MARLKESLTPYFLLIPSFFVLFLLMIFPMMWNVYIALHDVSIINIAKSWNFIGLENFYYVFTDEWFWKSLLVSAKFVAACVAGQFLAGFSLAYVLSKGRWSDIFRPIYLLPWFMSIIVAGYSWQMLYHTRLGFINNYLLHVDVPWLASPDIAVWSVAIANIWWGSAFTILFMETSLTSIDPEVLDAAEVDGATGFKKLRYVILPLIKPFIAINLILITMWTVNLFDLILVMTRGGPLFSTRTTSLYMYQQAFDFAELSVGSAAGIILLVINLLLAYFYLKVSR
jgi:multiple sugar transport system permease protein